MKQTLLTFIIALLAATGAWAQTTFTADNLKYTVTDAEAKTVELTGYETAPTGALTIPATVTNESTEYSVTSIGSSAFSSCSSLTAVTISDGVTSIGSSAFSSCYYLTAVNIPASVTSIGSSAFSSCYYLTAVNIPASVTNIGSSAFSWCSRLTAVTIPEGVATIGNYAFERCSALEKVTLPEGITYIGDKAFYNCTGLTEMTVLATTPPTVGSMAFNSVSRDIPVYVPATSLATYQAANVWNEFKLQAISTTGVPAAAMPESIAVYDGMLHNPQALEVRIFYMSGREVYRGNATNLTLPTGIYIVRCGEATIKAVF